VIIQTNSGYVDFQSVVGALGAIRSIFYFTNGSGGIFVAYAITEDGKNIVTSGNITTQPATFSGDFPAAIALTGLLALS
jgi:hypothetical protein